MAVTVWCLFFLLIAVAQAQRTCTQSDQTRCLGVAGLPLSAVLCTVSDPSTCNPDTLCVAEKWAVQNQCLRDVPCTVAFDEAGCLATYQVCTQEFRDVFCALPPTAGPPTPEPPTAAPPTLPPGRDGLSGVTFDAATGRPSHLTFATSGTYLSFEQGCTAAAGVEMAFAQVNGGGGVRGTELRLHFNNTVGIDLTGFASYNAVWSAVMDLDVFGLVSTSMESSQLLFDTISNVYNIPHISPLTDDATLLFSRAARNVMHARPGIDAELRGAFNHAIHGRPRCTRWGILFMDVGNVRSYRDQFAEMADEYGLEHATVAIGWPGPPAASLSAEFSRFANETYRPNCIFLMTSPDVVVNYTAHLLRHPFVDRDAYVFAGSAGSPVEPVRDPLSTTTDGGENDTSMLAGRLIVALPIPDPRHPTSPLAANYRAARAAFEFPPARSACPPGIFFSQFGEYIAGRFIAEVVRRMETISREEFLRTVYSSKMFVIDDLVLGPYSDECIGIQRSESMACFCNIGARSIFTTAVDAAGHFAGVVDDPQQGEFGAAELMIPLSGCRIERNGDYIPISSRFGILQASGAHGAAAQDFREALWRTMIASNERRNAERAMSRTYFLNVTFDAAAGAGTVSAAAARAVERYGVLAFVGHDLSEADLEEARSRQADAPVLLVRATLGGGGGGGGGLRLPTNVPAMSLGALELVPRLQDYVHTLAGFAVEQLASGGAVVVVATSSEEAQHAERSLNTFGASAARTAVVAPGATAGGAVSGTIAGGSTGDVFLVVSQDAAAVAGAVSGARASSAGVTVLVATAEELLERAIVGGDGSAAPANVHFASVFPPFWSRDASGFGRAVEEHDAAGRRVRGEPPRVSAVPATAVRAAFAFFAMNLGAEATGAAAAREFSRWWFMAGTRGVLDIALGPLSATCNKAVQQFNVLRLRDWATRAGVDSRVMFRYRNEGCHVVYRGLPHTGLSNLELAVIIVGCVLGAAIVVLAALAATRGRDNSAAPKDPTKPFAIAFTDIEKSTTLWAQDPEAMVGAVEQHHKTLRTLVQKHRGYEVKSIGDSLMVAFASPHDAVAFALESQTALMAVEWGTSSFDDIYAEKVREALEEAAAGSGGKLDAATERAMTDSELWRGLRVRVGVNFGMGSVQKDPVTGGFDYYGGTVNAAARIESVGNGGQVLVGEAVYNAVYGTGGGVPADVVVVDLGPQPLRGLSAPLRLYQCTPRVLQGRRFAPLRLDVELDEEREDELESVAETRSSGGSTHHTLHAVEDSQAVIARLTRRHWRDPAGQQAAITRLRDGLAFVTGALATSTTKYRTEFIGHVAERWRVPRPKRASDERVARVADEGTLAQVLAKVLLSIEAKEQREEGEQHVDEPHTTTDHNLTKEHQERADQQQHHSVTAGP